MSPSQIRGSIGELDATLAGGFIPGRIMLVQGRPDAGGTVLAQMCFGHARPGGRAAAG